VSIAAEIIALQWGGRGDRLAEREGPIHHHAPSRALAASVDAAGPSLGHSADGPLRRPT
jgi:xanthine dehydrogenase accessory factor